MTMPNRQTLRMLRRQMLLIDRIYVEAERRRLIALADGEGLQPDPREGYIDWPDPGVLSPQDSIALFEMMEDLDLVTGFPRDGIYRIRPTELYDELIPSAYNGTFVSASPKPEIFDSLDYDLEVRQLSSKGVFIVHGEDTSLDDTLLKGVSRFVRENLGREPIVLDLSRSNDYLWASFEREAAACAVAICIWTADRDDPQSGFIRPNVTLETGYFLGRLGVDRVIVIQHSNVKHPPSDLGGRTYLTEEDWERNIEARLDAAFGMQGR